ncbi:phage tail assembly chaperone [Citrobacter freundii]|uniref:phage tail assembly chaperone n=1 Tax=Citrobacter freundii TaxID=546 RepID=UPI0025CAC5F9|nr:phage tail assembly chaperone [Citrobacter freundii]MDN4292762.1 phage tail assembly chaperone [Citrobacter freundii]
METVKRTVNVRKPGGEDSPLTLTFKIPSLAELQAAPNQPTPTTADALLYMIADWDADMPFNADTARLFAANYPGALNDVLQAWGQAVSQAHGQRIGAAAPAAWSGVRDRYH